MELLTLILAKTAEEQLLELVPWMLLTATLMGIFGAILNRKRRGEETEEGEETKEEEETEEPLDQVEEVKDMINGKLPGMDAKSLKKRLKDER